MEDCGRDGNDDLGVVIVAREVGVNMSDKPGEIPANPDRSGASTSASDELFLKANPSGINGQ